MKTLKRLNLKKCTELKSAEMKEILGGGSVVEVTCIPQENCGQICYTPDSKPGFCETRDLPYSDGFQCVCVPWSK